MTKPKTTIEPYPGEIVEASKNSDGWVYRISGRFDLSEQVPASAIIGAWKVNSDGIIEGEFKFNPDYDPQIWGQPN